MRVSLTKLAQPSTWAGIGLLWALFAPSGIPYELVVNAVTAVCALLAVVLNEGKPQA